MSKRWGNVINPDDIIEQYGADSLRLYEMFMGPFGQATSWSTNGVKGVRKFLDKVYSRCQQAWSKQSDEKNRKLLHRTIKKVTEDIEHFSFNTAIPAMMIYMNTLENTNVSQEDMERFLLILSPFAPHLAEELWHQLGHTDSIFKATWPQYDPELAKDDEIELVVQVNGKVRSKLIVSPEISKEEALAKARADETVKKWIDGKKIINEIFVPGKIINIVVND
jgi:leucyl-tRNA synthetase